MRESEKGTKRAIMEETIAHRRQRRRRRQPVWPYTAVACLLILLIIGIAAAIVQGALGLELTLKGPETMTLEFGERFEDPGVEASFGWKNLQSEVQIENGIEPDRLGTFTVTYTIQYRGKTASATRTVRVVDTTPPTIVLMYQENSLTLPGHVYQEEGFVAEDNFDGDITDRVQRVVENGTVLYKVTDSSGNTAEASRPIRYGDNTAPDLKLLGDETITIFAGAPFTDPGYTAVDDADGDVGAKVTVSGDFDRSTPGTYTLRYTVTDSSGNTAEATRTIIVKESNQPPIVEPEGKVIYLTFDDGPSKYTPELLEVLAKYNVKATFFVVGTAATGYLDDIVAGGHSIGIHSCSHKYSEIYASDAAFLNDISAMRQKIREYTGVDTTLMRFPGGSSNKVSKKYCEGIMTRLTGKVTELGYQYFDWNVSSGDAGEVKTADEVYQNVINGVQKHKVSIVLQHDIYKYSVDAVERIIQWGLANGYTFLPLDPSSPNAHHVINN